MLKATDKELQYLLPTIAEPILLANIAHDLSYQLQILICVKSRRTSKIT